jgi:hypothetical protein
MQPLSSLSSLLTSRRSCPRCNTQMALIRIEPDTPTLDRRTFECPACEHCEVALVPYVPPGAPRHDRHTSRR